ncbi:MULTISPECIES: hypothetical protein [unclassified Bradyrhizobium]|uniref:hypothetical protein n=1 Tax=unclassified Bradyrhizobium TaxID=2631580 RepID=UPI002916AD1C|nr:MULTISPECIES: hypothetical protein [unclassified Bradyrhizobium]
MATCDTAFRHDSSTPECPTPDKVEAFWEPGEVGPLGPSTYRAGYRIRATGSILCSVEFPAAIAETAIVANLALATTITPDGYIRSTISGIADLTSKAEPIDQLIAQSFSVENLRLEGISAVDLGALLERLERSVALLHEVIKHRSD